MSHPISQVAKFMKLGGQFVPEDTDREISGLEVNAFAGRAYEELFELFSAIEVLDGNDHHLGIKTELSDSDIAECLDAAIDLAYVSFTLALRLVGEEKATEAWDAVAKANLSKVDGSLGPVRRDESGKIMKPEGFKHPDIEKIVSRGADE